MPSIISRLQKNRLCCGCGICVAICPKNALAIEWNSFGEYEPIQIHECNDCGLCQKVCPFENNNPNEDTLGKNLFASTSNINYTRETGYYLTSYVGHVASEERRWKSASGGLATWFLEKLLQENIVDAVLCVRKSTVPASQREPQDNPPLYEFFVARTAEEIRSSAGSAYYPTELSGVIHHVLDTPGRYAVIGLPCVIKSIRLAQQKNKYLLERIVVIAGLTCGHMMNTGFTKYIAHMAGLDGKIASVSYRCKSMERPALLYSYSYVGENGDNVSILWDKISKVWNDNKYIIPACNFCDDIFAELADITFMDAWLPEYSCNPRGTSLSIIRSELAAQMFTEDSNIVVSDIPIEKVIRSQCGVIWNKRDMLSYRLARAKVKHEVVPVKRVKPAVLGGGVFRIRLIIIKLKKIGFAMAGKVLRKFGLLK